jgi:hypothetical protein
MSATKQPEEKDSSLAGIVFIGIILAGLGAFLGFLFLASVAPTSYKSVAALQAHLEKNPAPKLLERSYFEGPISRDGSWEQKRDAFLNGSDTTVELSAGEINAWLSAKFRQPSSAAPAGDEEEADILVLPGVPNCFIDADEGFFLNLPTEVTIYGSAHDCLIVAQGHFSAAPQAAFQLDALHANDAAIPLLGGLGDQLVGALLQAYSLTDEFVVFQEAWKKVESVELVADTIRLKLRK